MTLDEFIAAYEKDDNLWWRTEAGEHQNHFEELVHQRETLRASLAAMKEEKEKAEAALLSVQNQRDEIMRVSHEDAAAMCRAREALQKYGWHHRGYCAHSIHQDNKCDCGYDAALSSTDPCRHEEKEKEWRHLACEAENKRIDAEAEAKRLREAVSVLCRKTLGAIIDAETVVQVEKLSGNVVKEAHAKGNLFTLRLFESWLDRHVPETMAELRRRAKGEG